MKKSTYPFVAFLTISMIGSKLAVADQRVVAPTIPSSNLPAVDQTSSQGNREYYSPYANWRIGIGAAVEYIHSDTSLKIVPQSTLGNFGNKQSQTGKKLQAAPSFEIGKTLADAYYLGLFASWHYAGISDTTLSPIRAAQYFLHQFNLYHYTDILLKAGYKVTPRAMIYGLIGPSIASWSHTSNVCDGNNSIIGKVKSSKVSTGLGLGLGLEFLHKEKYAVSLDYIYHFQKVYKQNQTITIENFGPRRGNLSKSVGLSYSTLALRFTMFFNL